MPIQPQARLTATQSAMDIERAHLFGQAAVTGGMGNLVRSTVSLSVNGILYADDAQDSVAMLSIEGQTVVVHVGSELSTGDKVTGISPDSVQISGPDGISDLRLDIRLADTNQRISPLGIDGAGGAEAAIAGAQLPAQSGSPVAMPTVPVTLVPTHFQSLGALRGRKAPDHFSAIKPP